MDFYVNYNEKNYSLKFLKKDMDEIELEDAIKAITYKNSKSDVLKVLSDTVSVRRGNTDHM